MKESSQAPNAATEETTMPKGQQRSNREARKPKKDSSPAKPVTPPSGLPTVTTVVPDRSKKKK